jgi:hypothetical protein
MMHEWRVLNWFKVFECVLRLRFKLCKLFENMSCWTVYILWRKHDLNDFKVFNEMLDCLVLREHDLAKHDFTTWYSSERYTDQVHIT